MSLEEDRADAAAIAAYEAKTSIYETLILKHKRALERFRTLCEMCINAGLTLERDQTDEGHLDLKSPKDGPYNVHVQVTLSNMSDPKAELVVWGSVDTSGAEYVRIMIMTMTCSETGWFCAIDESGDERISGFRHVFASVMSRRDTREGRHGRSFYYPNKPVAFAEFDRCAATASRSLAAWEGLCVYGDFTDALGEALVYISDPQYFLF